MSVESAISLTSISKVFKRYKRPADRLKEMILPGKSYAQEFWALKDITLDIPCGETLGILGRNGAGKSTLLKIITGTLQPTSGKVTVNGRVSALLELGSGFNPEFTGRQNVFFNGRLLGLNQSELENRFDDIVAFADIGDFLEQPVKTYSSGMRARLAFAVASSIDPDVLIVDEVLAVGDGIFVHKCMKRIEKIIDGGKCVLFVSHNTAYINSLCSKCLWLDHGELQAFGTASEVSKTYQAFMANSNAARVEDNHKTPESALESGSNFQLDSSIDASALQTASVKKQANINSFTQKEYLSSEIYDRFGTGRCEILNVRLMNSRLNEIGFIMPGEVLKIVIQAIAHDKLLKPIFGVTMFNRLRVPICGWNSQQYNYELGNISEGETLEFEIHLEWPSIAADIYAFEAAVAESLPDNTETLDWIQTPKTIKSGCKQKIFGLMRMHENKVAMSHTLSL